MPELGAGSSRGENARESKKQETWNRTQNKPERKMFYDEDRFPARKEKEEEDEIRRKQMEEKEKEIKVERVKKEREKVAKEGKKGTFVEMKDEGCRKLTL